MAKLGIDADYIGTDYSETRPRARITEEELEILASDQASVYQSIIGKDLDGGSLTGAAIHVHDGTSGALLPHPLSYVHTRGAQTWPSAGDLNAVNVTLYPAQFDTSLPQRVLYHWPVFAPAGCTAARVYVRGNPALIEMYPTLHVDSTVGQWDTAFALDYDGLSTDGVFFYDITLTGGAVNYLTLMLNQPWNASGNAQVFQVDVCPRVWRKVPTEEPDPAASTVSGQVTGQVHTATFLPIYDTYTKDGKPLSSAVTGPLAANQSLIHELLTDQPAYGYSAGHGAQVDGHWHDGSATGSAAIDVPLFSECFGAAATSAANVNGLDADDGNDDRGPLLTHLLTEDTYYTVRHGVFAVPDKSGAAVWTANFAVTLYVETTSEVTVKLWTGNEPDTSDRSTTATAVTGPGWKVATGTIDVDDNGLCYFKLDVTISDEEYNAIIPGTFDQVTITGLAVYLT